VGAGVTVDVGGTVDVGETVDVGGTVDVGSTVGVGVAVETSGVTVPAQADKTDPTRARPKSIGWMDL
jgi:hypothetical protein